MRRPLGQHFIFDTNILNKILRYSNTTSKDHVIEIGPGLGTMTRLLSERVKKVTAIEYDKKLIPQLKANLKTTSNVEIIAADALKFPYESIPGTFKVVSNIPYYITTPLLFRLLEYRDKIASMTLLLQKEVARRIVALPGSSDYGILSISAQIFTEPFLQFSISKKVFTPPPDVDSAVVFFKVHKNSRYAIEDVDFFKEIVKRAFSQRRKTIMNSLKSYDNIKGCLEKALIDPSIRPETLSIEDFARLSNILNPG